MLSDNPLGIYEKALPRADAWRETLLAARKAGFDFVEFSIDESDERLARLNWGKQQLRELKAAIDATGIGFSTLCLSAHRRFPFASENSSTRARAYDIWARAFDLCHELGIRVIQTQGHDVYYEDSTESTWGRYLEGLARVAEMAARASVMVGIENADLPCVGSVDDALSLVRQCDSPWMQLYPDTGNTVAHGHDVYSQLLNGRGHIVAVHVKDARPGVFRRVPFGQGAVCFERAFRALAEQNYTGPLVIEMWNEGLDDAASVVSDAKVWVTEAIQQAVGEGETTAEV